MLTLYFNPSSFLRFEKVGLQVPEHACIYVDSILLNRILRATGVDIPRRCFDFSYEIGDAEGLFRSCKKDDFLLFIGGTAEEANRFQSIVEERYNLKSRIMARTGFSNNLKEDIEQLLEQVNATHLVLGIGAPFQEQLALYFNSLHPDIDIRTCGGFITQTAMKGGDFYPKLIQKFGMRWLYRFLKQPNVILRVLFEYPIGTWRFIRSDLRKRFTHQ